VEVRYSAKEIRASSRLSFGQWNHVKEASARAGPRFWLFTAEASWGSFWMRTRIPVPVSVPSCDWVRNDILLWCSCPTRIFNHREQIPMQSFFIELSVWSHSLFQRGIAHQVKQHNRRALEWKTHFFCSLCFSHFTSFVFERVIGLKSLLSQMKRFENHPSPRPRKFSKIIRQNSQMMNLKTLFRQVSSCVSVCALDYLWFCLNSLLSFWVCSILVEIDLETYRVFLMFCTV
jgi:hypothetical protein